MDITTLKSGITSTIKTNGTQAITGQILQTQLLNICDTLNNGKEDNFTVGDGLELENGILKAEIVDNTSSTASDKSLSANMGKELNDKINNIGARGRFLSTWNCTTGLPGTNPTSLPYNYAKGDYFIVSAVGSTNYIPNGSSYDGTASQTTSSTSIAVNDTFLYDGTSWILLSNAQREITWTSITGDPEDNEDLAALFAEKTDKVTPATANNIAVLNASGNLADGGKSVDELDKNFVVTFTRTAGVITKNKTYAEILAAYNAGKNVYGILTDSAEVYVEVLRLSKYQTTNGALFFANIYSQVETEIYITAADSIIRQQTAYENVARKITTTAVWEGQKTSTTYYPSAFILEKLLSNKKAEILESTLNYEASQTYTLAANTYSMLDCSGAASGDAITFALGSSVVGAYTEYMLELTTGSNVPTITLPSGVTWYGGSEPTFNTNKTYQISIVRNLGVCTEF